MSFQLGLLLLSLMKSISCLEEVVQTKNGLVRGTTVEFRKLSLQVFLGIPFAEPPIGKLRFKKPRPVEKWSGILEADSMPPACIQFLFYPFPWYDFHEGKSEDCLYLNIWLPYGTQKSDSKAVMFWIYGGGFTVGSNRMPEYDGRVLATAGDVIVVTINYRMASLGFLYSGSEEAPGNVGMYDQLTALKWVNENIKVFGGDPNRITLFGQSAGSISISLLCISPLAKGLFHRIIMESGSAAFFKDDHVNSSLNLSQKLAKAVNCATDEKPIYQFPEEVVGCLREVDAMHLAKTLASFNPSSARSYFPIIGGELFPILPPEALTHGYFYNVSVLIGNNKDEGSFQLSTGHPDVFGFFGHKDTLVNKSYALSLLKGTFSTNPTAEAVYEHYIADVADGNYDKIRQRVYTAMGDYSLRCPTVYFAESYAKENIAVHYYYFEHRPANTPWAEWMGVAHYEEIQFVFGLPYLYPRNFTNEEKELSYRMMKIWTDFAKTGRLHWKLYTLDDHVYRRLVVRSDEIKKSFYGTGPHLQNCNFFREYFGFTFESTSDSHNSGAHQDLIPTVL